METTRRQDSPDRLSHAESARTLLAVAKRGVLATIARDDGYPYASVVELLPTDDGEIVVFLSDLAEHTSNFTEDPRVSVVVSEDSSGGDVLALGRATLQGRIERVADRDVHRQDYLGLHPEASTYIDFGDFSFYCIRVERVRYIGGFGRMSWIARAQWVSASPDPLADIAAGVIEHMNDDHAQNLLDYAHAFTDADWATEATMVRLDRHGFDMRVRDDDRSTEVRVGFASPKTTSDEVHEVMVRLAREARELVA